MKPDTIPMHRLSLRFKDAGLETAYVEEQERKAARPRRMGAVGQQHAVAAVLVPGHDGEELSRPRSGGELADLRLG